MKIPDEFALCRSYRKRIAVGLIPNRSADDDIDIDFDEPAVASGCAVSWQQERGQAA